MWMSESAVSTRFFFVSCRHYCADSMLVSVQYVIISDNSSRAQKKQNEFRNRAFNINLRNYILIVGISEISVALNIQSPESVSRPPFYASPSEKMKVKSTWSRFKKFLRSLTKHNQRFNTSPPPQWIGHIHFRFFLYIGLCTPKSGSKRRLN